MSLAHGGPGGRLSLWIVWSVAAWLLLSPSAPAQNGAPAAPAPAVPAAAPVEAAPAAAAPATVPADPSKAPPAKKGALEWFIHSSGWIGLFIFGLSVYFVATVARLFIEMRLVVEVPPVIVTQCHGLIEQKNLQAIYEVVSADNSFFSRVLATGIAELHNGLNDAREAMERVGEAATVEMERRISILAVLGTLGPMIGLLGTLQGMISSFSAIAMSDVQLNASEVAGGISQALVLTFEGVALSVPSIYFFAFFRNRVAVISVNAILESDQILRRLARALRKRPPAPPAAAPTA